MSRHWEEDASEGGSGLGRGEGDEGGMRERTNFSDVSDDGRIPFLEEHSLLRENKKQNGRGSARVASR